MLAKEIKQLKTEPPELRKFGLLVGVAFVLLAAWSAWRGKPGFPYFMSVAVPLIALGLVWARSLKWIYICWMSLGLTLGLVVSTVLLTLFFYLAVTPVGLLARLLGKDFLSRRLDRDANSYWIRRTPSGTNQRRRYEQ